jgi:hypothetical protein
MAGVTRVLADGAVTSAKILDGTIATGDLASSVGNFGAWTAYTPTLTAATTNPVISGTGAYANGTYAKIGRVVTGKCKIQFGSTGSAGSGAYSISLPVTARAAATGEAGTNGYGYLYNGNTTIYVPIQALQVTTTTVSLYYGATYNGAATIVTHSAPWAWISNCAMEFQFQYEAAS